MLNKSIVDVLTWLAWKTSVLPVNKVLGTGTHLATSRFRYMIGDRLGIAGSSVHGYIVGESGESAGNKIEIKRFSLNSSEIIITRSSSRFFTRNE